MRAVDPGTLSRLGAAVCCALLMALAWTVYRSPAMGLVLDAFPLCR